MYSFKGTSGFQDLTDRQARKIIALLFDGYQKRKEEKRLYVDDEIPKLVIKIYYSCVEKPTFEQLVNNFKKKYINNESKMENAYSPDEKKGLAAAYDYIQKRDDFEGISIYDLSYIHEELYSKMPNPEFGGKYRNQDIYLLEQDGKSVHGGNVELCPYWNITHEMNLLQPEVEQLVKDGISLSKRIDSNGVIEYINRCITLKCKLIKIHPFRDGNGRSVRAFINLLFRLANIPPVYVENKEKLKYIEALNKALVSDDYQDIRTFYMYKICDSIIQLDLSLKAPGKDVKYTDDSSPSDIKNMN